MNLIWDGHAHGGLHRVRRTFAVILGAALLLLVSAAAAQAANTIDVNVADDPGGAGDCLNSGPCSLRQAIAAASDGDTVQLHSATYKLQQGTNITISKSLTLEGDGVDATLIDGSQNSGSNQFGNVARILKVTSGTVLIHGMTFTGGRDETDENCPSSCSVINENGGGDLFNQGGSVTLDHVAFTNNPGAFLGGAVSNNGDLAMTDVSFTNDIGDIGGAFFSRGGTVTGNGVTIENDASSCCVDSAVYLLRGSVVLTNTTVVGNGGAASLGGGIHNAGADLSLINDTLSDNVRGSIETNVGATTSVANTIIGAGFADGSDGDCVAAGKPDPANDFFQSGPAITHDNGNNIDQDGSCGLTAPSDFSNVDPHLASIADNGGPTRTEALLAGSKALDAANPDVCPATDQRDFERDGQCDIGAFEAHPIDPPSTPTTGDAQNITNSSADLTGTINLNGDAGAFHFLWGVSSDPADLRNSTPVQGTGIVASDTLETQTLSNLNPGTTYFYEIVADNSTGSKAASNDNVKSFTTLANPPSVFNVNEDSVTDTTANLSFTINPNGADTSYVIRYGDADPGQDHTTDPIDIGANAGDQQLTATLQNLDPNSTYHFEVIATNSVDSTTQSGQDFATDQQIGGIQRLPIELDDSGTSNFGCPQTARIDWGDNSGVQNVVPDCLFPGDEENPAQYSLTADHTYAQTGHYEIQITYTDIEKTSTQFAQIVANDVQPPANNTLPAISGTPSPGNSLTCSDGSWSNSPTGFAFAWKRDGSPISGATAQTYLVQAADQGHALTCTVVAHNDSGSSSPATSAGVGVPSGSSGGSGSKPTSNKASTSATQPTSTAFDGTVNPGGLATTAHFEYGLDSKYTNPGSSGPVYDQSTPSQNVGSDSSSHAVSASVSGLVPKALYHVRLVATNSAGTTFGPDTTFTTPPAPAPGAPTITKSIDVKPTQGVVLIEVNGKLVPLTQLKQIPAGAVIDALHGSLTLETAIGTGHKTQTGTFGGAIFKVTQDHSGLTTLALVENAFKGAPSYASCNAPSGKASAAALSKKVLQLLHAKDNHGKFRTKGRYAAATTRGTVWTIADRCDGTLTRVTQDSVLINDLVRHINLILRAGHSYLALAKPPRHR